MVGVGICSIGFKMQDAAAHQQASQHCQFQLFQQEKSSLHVQQRHLAPAAAIGVDLCWGC